MTAKAPDSAPYASSCSWARGGRWMRLLDDGDRHNDCTTRPSNGLFLAGSVDDAEAPVGGLDLFARFLGDGDLGGPRVGVVADGQTQQRSGVLERPTPVGEVVRTARVAGVPPAHVEFEPIKAGLLSEIHCLDQLVVPNQVPVLGHGTLLGRLEQVAGGAQLAGTDDSRFQPAGAINSGVALPYHEVGHQLVQQSALGGAEGAFFRGAHRRDLVADAGAL